MSTQIQTRRGTTSQHSTFTGAAGEITVDTDKNVVVVHDGSTAGGHPLVTAAAALTSSDIGSTVQGYDADTAKTDVAQTFTAQQTFGELKEGVYTLATTGSIALDPANGSIQTTVLTGAPTFTNSLESGQAITLHIENGSTYTVTWPTMTWVSSGGNSAPTLTAKDVVALWQVSTVLYGAYVGSYA